MWKSARLITTNNWLQILCKLTQSLSTHAMKSKCHNGPTNTFLLSSPLGDLELVSCPRGLHALSHTAVSTDDQFQPDNSISVSILSQLYEDNGYTYKPVLQAVEWLQRYFSRDPSVLSQPRPDICFLDRNEGTFRERVWETLADQVKYGQSVSYGELARMCGSPGASQAVGSAMRNNPVSIIIPCHRVILSSGRTGNYSGGKKNSMKVWLLNHEGALTRKDSKLPADATVVGRKSYSCRT